MPIHHSPPHAPRPSPLSARLTHSALRLCDAARALRIPSMRSTATVRSAAPIVAPTNLRHRPAGIVRTGARALAIPHDE